MKSALIAFLLTALLFGLAAGVTEPTIAEPEPPAPHNGVYIPQVLEEETFVFWVDH